MRSLWIPVSLFLAACGAPNIEAIRTKDIEEAHAAFLENIQAIRVGDTEAYLAQYLQSPELVRASGDTVQQGYITFAAERRASPSWPDTLGAGNPVLVWLAPGVVYAVYPYRVTQDGETSNGWSERILIKTGGGWKIAVTSVMEAR